MGRGWEGGSARRLRAVSFSCHTVGEASAGAGAAGPPGDHGHAHVSAPHASQAPPPQRQPARVAAAPVRHAGHADGGAGGVLLSAERRRAAAWPMRSASHGRGMSMAVTRVRKAAREGSLRAMAAACLRTAARPVSAAEGGGGWWRPRAVSEGVVRLLTAAERGRPSGGCARSPCASGPSGRPAASERGGRFREPVRRPRRGCAAAPDSARPMRLPRASPPRYPGARSAQAPGPASAWHLSNRASAVLRGPRGGPRARWLASLPCALLLPAWESRGMEGRGLDGGRDAGGWRRALRGVHAARVRARLAGRA